MAISYTAERVSLAASDGTKLVATFHDGGAEACLLLHQLRLDRTSWDWFARRLQEAGFSALALDLRGHGESDGKWESLGEEGFRAMLLDVEAGAALLRSRGKRVAAVIGASIGANTAFRFSSENRVPAVLLSPGLEYRGIDLNTLTSTAPTLIIVAEGDAYSSSSSRELDANNLFGEHRLLLIPGERHGTHLLTEPEVAEAILSFLGKAR